MSTTILSELKGVIPKDRFSIDEVGSNYLGNGGEVTVCPESEQEIIDLISFANSSGQSVSIMGAGTKRGYGGLVERTDILLSMKNYSGIVEHIPGDMTITVKSGTPFGELQEYLSKFNQKVSIDPFIPQHSTVGGIIAANDSGPKRFGYGSARDSVIGLRIIYPDGSVIRAGGKVVKNVAGYDMNKLFIGSMGTLGVLSEVTFKLRPLPKSESLVLLSFSEGSLDQIKEFAVRLLDSILEPVAFELMNPALSEKLTGNCRITLAIGFEDVESSVLFQENYIKGMKPDSTHIKVLNEEDTRDFWKKIYENQLFGTSDDLQASVKIGVVNLDVLSIINESIELVNPGRLEIQAHGGLGHGLCRVVFKGEDELVLNAIRHLRKKAGEYGGYAIVTHLPFEFRKQIDVWGEKPPYFFLMEGIKKTIDPKNTLNRQRFLGGI